MERLEGRIDGQTAIAGELERLMAIVKPVMDEQPCSLSSDFWVPG
jgi:hypothetical protein